MIDVYMSFYPTTGGEINRRQDMPQVPCTGDTLFYSLSGDPGDSRPWRVIHVAWVHEGSWHAEIGLD
jgi:hypothetical protein